MHKSLLHTKIIITIIQLIVLNYFIPLLPDVQTSKHIIHLYIVNYSEFILDKHMIYSAYLKELTQNIEVLQLCSCLINKLNTGRC